MHVGLTTPISKQAEVTHFMRIIIQIIGSVYRFIQGSLSLGKVYGCNRSDAFMSRYRRPTGDDIAISSSPQ